MPSIISITVVNETRKDINPCQPTCSATIPSSLNSTPPESVRAGHTNTGGVFTFDPNLCAISAYETPDPNHIWILFVHVSTTKGLILKTLFCPVTKQIDSILVNDIRNIGAFCDSATHSFAGPGVDVTFKATSRTAEADMELDDDISVEFKLTASPSNNGIGSVANPSNALAPSHESKSEHNRDLLNSAQPRVVSYNESDEDLDNGLRDWLGSGVAGDRGSSTEEDAEDKLRAWMGSEVVGDRWTIEEDSEDKLRAWLGSRVVGDRGSITEEDTEDKLGAWLGEVGNRE